jgi:hypothetical protein
MGLCMLNVCFSFGHKLLNSHSPRIMYLVNASLFIYLVHHPLTILYGIYVTPHISSNTLGFFVGLADGVWDCFYAVRNPSAHSAVAFPVLR